MYESKVKYYYGTGRRKHSVARVRLYPGNGSITINGRSIDEYFGLDTLKLIVRQPLALTENLENMDIVCTVAGGGVTGQAGRYLHSYRRRCHRSGWCDPSRHLPCSAGIQSGTASGSEEGWLPHS